MVRYNVRTDTADQSEWAHRWTFFVVNTLTEIGRIKQRVLDALAPTGECAELAEDRIPRSRGLRYEAFALSSNKGVLDAEELRKIYDNPRQIKKDRALNDRNGEIWFGTVYAPRFSV